MPLFKVHVRVTYVEYYVVEIEAATVKDARSRALEEDNHRDGMSCAEHVETEVEAVNHADSGIELWNESDGDVARLVELKPAKGTTSECDSDALCVLPIQTGTRLPSKPEQ